MVEKKSKGTAIFEMLFLFLAISKIMYWFNTIFSALQSGLGDAAEVILVRFLNQDIMVLAGVILFYFLDKAIDKVKSKDNRVILNIASYVIGYILLMGVFIAYFLLIGNLVVGYNDWNMLFDFFRYSIIWYVVIIIILSIKDYLKTKEKKITDESPTVYSNEEKLSMLEVLFSDGILTEAEYDQKKKKLLGI